MHIAIATSTRSLNQEGGTDLGLLRWLIYVRIRLLQTEKGDAARCMESVYIHGLSKRVHTNKSGSAKHDRRKLPCGE